MTCSTRISLLSCLVLSALYAPATALQPAQAVPQVFGRQTFQGGWAMNLPGAECPSDVPVKCKGNLIENPACCPANTFCDGLGALYCCPTETDCGNIVSNFPKCADSSWTMYKLEKMQGTYFCCPAGQFGVLPLATGSKSYGGFCLPDGEAVAASRLAVKASDAKTTVTATTRTVQTMTSVSTVNGKETTIILITTPRVTFTQTNNILGDATAAVPTSSGTKSASDASSTSASPPPSSPLGPGPIAGIVIGGLGVIALFLVAFLLYRRRKSTPPAANYTYEPPTHQQQPDMGVYPTHQQQPITATYPTHQQQPNTGTYPTHQQQPDTGTYPTHQQQPDTGTYPTHQQQTDTGDYPSRVQSPVLSNAGTATVVGSPPVIGHAQPHQGYKHYGPPPPAAGYSEVQGQNTWEGPGRQEIGPGR